MDTPTSTPTSSSVAGRNVERLEQAARTSGEQPSTSSDRPVRR